MNIKLFYTIKAVDEKIPSDIIQIIWHYVMNNSASMIQRMYIFKVSRHIDAFNIIRNHEDILNKNYYDTYIYNYFTKQINYNYIQEPSVWLRNLRSMQFSFEPIERDEYWVRHRKNFLNIYIKGIKERITNTDEIYRNTGISWWGYF